MLLELFSGEAELTSAFREVPDHISLNMDIITCSPFRCVAQDAAIKERTALRLCQCPILANRCDGGTSVSDPVGPLGNGMISSIEALRMISLQLQDFLLLFEIASGFGRVAFCGVGYPVPRT